MGSYMNAVREGIEEWAQSDDAASTVQIEGFDKLYNLFMNDDKFTKAVMENAEKVDTSFLGHLTEKALTQVIGELDEIAMKHGGSYEPMVAAYNSAPETMLQAIENRDLAYIDCSGHTRLKRRGYDYI